MRFSPITSPAFECLLLESRSHSSSRQSNCRRELQRKKKPASGLLSFDWFLASDALAFVVQKYFRRSARSLTLRHNGPPATSAK